MEANGHRATPSNACPPNLNATLTSKVGKVLEVLAQIGDSI